MCVSTLTVSVRVKAEKELSFFYLSPSFVLLFTTSAIWYTGWISVICLKVLTPSSVVMEELSLQAYKHKFSNQRKSCTSIQIINLLLNEILYRRTECNASLQF